MLKGMSSLLPTSKVRWGILGAGNIAKSFAKGVFGSRHGGLVAVASREYERAKAWLESFPQCQARPIGGYDALLADPEVDAIYIATPHPQHVEWVVRAIEAGKHVLVEKPIGLNHAEAMVAVEAAREHGIFLMEAWMYRCHPQTRRVIELIQSGALGAVEMVQATFSFRSKGDPNGRLLANALGGGGILDVGGYPVSYARMVAGAIDGRPFLDPGKVQGIGRLHPETGVDRLAAAVLSFPNGLMAQVSAGVGLTQENVVRIYGSEGWLLVASPFVVAREATPTKLILHKGSEREEIVIEPDRGLWSYEADTVAEALLAGQLEAQACSLDDTLGNMRALDAWRAAIGLTYEAEKPENFTHTIKRRSLARRSDAPMRHGSIAGLGKPISRLVMGCDNQTTMPHAAAMWDDYLERGGNTFDTAWAYGGGIMEKLLGQWMRNRGVRDEVVVLGKGGITPNCYPEAIEKQLMASLERLQTDHLDIYCLHRDNLEIPVEEFVDLLDGFVKAGRFQVYGGSNWSIARIAEANEYAARTGKQGFSLLSNNFSLARMVDPVWPGCIASSDDASREWLTEHQFPLLPWSSQARGFFTDRAGRDQLSDSQLVRCWYSNDNFERRERAMRLAEENGTTPIAIAAAYVLAQPFPTFALIGPRTIRETVTSLACLDLELTSEEVAMLDLREMKEPVGA